jgi:hypothetical protein
MRTAERIAIGNPIATTAASANAQRFSLIAMKLFLRSGPQANPAAFEIF